MKVSKTGYKRNSKDKNEPALKIPSNHITMKGVDFPVFGISDTGHSQMMYPGMDYLFPGSSVYEIPMASYGGDPSIPDLSNRKEGGWLKKYQDAGQVMTYASNPDYFNSHAVYHDNPKANDLIRSKVYAGTHGWDPVNKALIKLDKPVSVPESTRERATEEWGKKSYKERFESNTPAGREVREAAVKNSMQAMVKNPLLYAPGAAAATVFGAPIVGPALGTLMEAPMVVAGTTVPGVTVGSTLGALGAGMSTQQLLDPTSVVRQSIDVAYENPNTENVLTAVGEVGLTGLGYVGLGIGNGITQGVQTAGNYLTQTPLKNAYKLNPFAKKLPGSPNAPIVEELRPGDKLMQRLLEREKQYTLTPDELRTMRGENAIHNRNISLSTPVDDPYLNSYPVPLKGDQIMMDSFSTPQEGWRWYNKKYFGIDSDKPIPNFPGSSGTQKKHGGWLSSYQDGGNANFDASYLTSNTQWIKAPEGNWMMGMQDGGIMKLQNAEKKRINTAAKGFNDYIINVTLSKSGGSAQGNWLNKYK